MHEFRGPPQKPQFLNQKISLNLSGDTSFKFYIGIWVKRLYMRINPDRIENRDCKALKEER
jgi:hypothetical protein